MKKKPVIILIRTLLLLLLSLNLISAINLDVSSKPISNSFIVELNEPAIFDLTIRNIGEKDSFEIYSLIGVDIFPETPFTIDSGETKIIRIKVIPQESIKSKRGFLTFEYRIKSSKNEIQKEQLTINIVDLGNAFSITPGNINPKSELAILSIKNNLMFNFTQLKVKMDSIFFSYSQNLSLNSLETKIIGIPIDKERLKTINAGQYLVNTRIETQGKTADIESIIKFLEQEDIETLESYEGIIKIRHEIIKKNVGNIKKTVKTTVKKNLISYLFTTVNILPTETKIENFKMHYMWEKELIPNQELEIIVTTNWFYPIIIILLIIGLFILIKKSIERDLSLRKNVSFVKTKGGQFALKITLRLKAKKFIERINIIDKLPPLVKLYEKFGVITPDKVDLKNRRLEWNIESLNKGEERIFTYIIYSMVGVVGRFELPSARATYEKEGKIKQTTSNRSFFINEPNKQKTSV